MAKKASYSFGSCTLDKIVPPPKRVSSKTPILNLFLTFEDALRLGISLDDCVRALNRLDRRTVEAKEARVQLVVYLRDMRLAVHKA